jgi:hypothetical protein
MSGSNIAQLFLVGPQVTAQVIGLPYNHYRPNGVNAPTGVGNLIGSINAWITADEVGRGNRAANYGKPVWYGMFDPTVTAVGDYFIGALGTFFIASQNVPQPMQVVMCNATFSISQPAGMSTLGAQSAYGADARATETIIATGWPGSLLMSSKQKAGTGRLPGDNDMPTAIVLLPAIPGVTIRNNLILTDANSQRRIVSSAELTALGWRLMTTLSTT